MGCREGVLHSVQYRAKGDVMQVRQQFVLSPENVEIGDTPLRAAKVLLERWVVYVAQEHVGFDFSRCHFPRELKPIQYLGTGGARVHALFAGHGMQELQIAKVGAGHYVASLCTSRFAAAHDGCGLGFLHP